MTPEEQETLKRLEILIDENFNNPLLAEMLD